MRQNTAKAKLRNGGKIINGWCSIPSSFSAEVYAHQGWDTVTIDLQHGPIDFSDALPMLQAISTSPAVPMARVPWNDPAMIMKLLDAGAFGLICPMINSADEARSFVGAARYAPAGFRSFGPNRVVQYAGADYWQHANEEVLLFAMIETRAALENLDEILAVPGLDGTYIGPSDLSLSMGKLPTLAPDDKEVLAAIAKIREATKARGLFAACHSDGAATAAMRLAEGFDLVTPANDVRMLTNAAAAAVRALKGPAAAAPAPGKTAY